MTVLVVTRLVLPCHASRVNQMIDSDHSKLINQLLDTFLEPSPSHFSSCLSAWSDRFEFRRLGRVAAVRVVMISEATASLLSSGAAPPSRTALRSRPRIVVCQYSDTWSMIEAIALSRVER